jgi:hypothetical protein
MQAESPTLENRQGRVTPNSKRKAGRPRDLSYFFRGNGLNYCANTSVIEAFYYITLKFD